MTDGAPDADGLKAEILSAIAAADTPEALDAVRVDSLGKKGRFTAVMKTLGKLDPDARREMGQRLNVVKDEILAALDARKAVLDAAALEARLQAERVDVTLPARPERQGHLHPIHQTLEEFTAIFADMGFQLKTGPEIESDWYNFEALNFPPDHPARQMQDTLYMPPGPEGETRVLRTHTSPIQIRTMLDQKPPIRILAAGRTYRADYDMTHTPMFSQIELLVIDRETHMGHLKGVLTHAMRTFFGVDDLVLRFRPSFFPFTEPSMEVDIACSRKGGELKIGNYGDWLEVLGSGMVHPNVIRNCGLDPAEYQGFAAGMGVERLAMLKYGIPDLRSFFESDSRWLRHYGFVPTLTPSLAQGL